MVTPSAAALSRSAPAALASRPAVRHEHEVRLAERARVRPDDLEAAAHRGRDLGPPGARDEEPVLGERLGRLHDRLELHPGVEPEQGERPPLALRLVEEGDGDSRRPLVAVLVVHGAALVEEDDEGALR